MGPARWQNPGCLWKVQGHFPRRILPHRKSRTGPRGLLLCTQGLCYGMVTVIQCCSHDQPQMWPHTNQLQSNQLHKHSDLHKELLACSFAVIKSCLASTLRAGVCRCTALCKSFAWSAPRTMSHDRHRMPMDVPSPWVSPFHTICGVLHQVSAHWGDICANSAETLVQQDRNCPRGVHHGGHPRHWKANAGTRYPPPYAPNTGSWGVFAPSSSGSQTASSCNYLMEQYHKLFTYLCSIYPKPHNTTKKNDHTASNLNEKLLFIHFHCNVTCHKILQVHEAASALLIIRMHYHFDEAFTQNCRTVSELLRCSQHPN